MAGVYCGRQSGARSVAPHDTTAIETPACGFPEMPRHMAGMKFLPIFQPCQPQAWITLQFRSTSKRAHPGRLMASYREIRSKVKHVIGADIVDELLEYVKEHAPALWGEDQPRGFLSAMVFLTLYKDLFGEGYHDLLSDIDLPFHTTLHSLPHNIQAIRIVLEQWANGQWECGSLSNWREAARRLNIPPKFPVSPFSKFSVLATFVGFENTSFFRVLLIQSDINSGPSVDYKL